jgi:hypothetical protein
MLEWFHWFASCIFSSCAFLHEEKLINVVGSLNHVCQWQSLLNQIVFSTTSPMHYHGTNIPRQWWRGHNNTFSPSGDRKDLAWVLRSSKGSTAAPESILTGCITAWYGNCSASDRKALQRVVRTAQYITGAKLHTIQNLYNSGVKGKSINLSETQVTQVRVFSLPPHDKQYQSAKSRTKRLLKSFYPQSIRLLKNS